MQKLFTGEKIFWKIKIIFKKFIMREFFSYVGKTFKNPISLKFTEHESDKLNEFERIYNRTQI